MYGEEVFDFLDNFIIVRLPYNKEMKNKMIFHATGEFPLLLLTDCENGCIRYTVELFEGITYGIRNRKY